MRIQLRSTRTWQLSTHPWLRSIAIFCFWTLIFALAYTQAPLYTSNQNQYFLHGLADAGLGFLKEDWLANTLDPTPAFSLLVSLSYRFLRLEALFYVYYALQMGVYLFSLLGIVSTVYDIRSSRPRYLVYLALLLLVHSAAWRFALSRTLGPSWAYIVEDGVAGQRLLGTVFEPSTFAVLLVLSIYLFLRRRPYLAVLCATLAATFHPTYLLSAATLTLAYMWVTFYERLPIPKRSRGFSRLADLAADEEPAEVSNPAKASTPVLEPFLIGLTALVSVLPILYYVFTNFANTPPVTTALAREILVHFRIPHHALVSWWFDATAVVKILLVIATLVMIRRTRIFAILLLPFLAAAGLTGAQILLKSDALALIFPWRLSIFLVPLATSLLLGALVSGLLSRYPGVELRHSSFLSKASGVVICLAVLVGIIRFALDLQRKANTPERPLMSYVANHHAPGEVYLTPVKLQDFRLAAGSPVLVEFKSIPYRDSDVLEWYRRIQLTDRFYQQADCSLLPILADEYGVTHVVLAGQPPGFTCPQLREHYRDDSFSLFALEIP